MGFAEDVSETFGVAGLTTIVCDTLGAAAKFVLPAWLATTTTVPTPVRFKLFPATLAGPVTVNVTGRLEDAVALSPIEADPNATGEVSVGKLIIWGVLDADPITLNVNAGELVPGAGFITTICGSEALLTSENGISATNCVALT